MPCCQNVPNISLEMFTCLASLLTLSFLGGGGHVDSKCFKSTATKLSELTQRIGVTLYANGANKAKSANGAAVPWVILQ